LTSERCEHLPIRFRKNSFRKRAIEVDDTDGLVIDHERRGNGAEARRRADATPNGRPLRGVNWLRNQSVANQRTVVILRLSEITSRRVASSDEFEGRATIASLGRLCGMRDGPGEKQKAALRAKRLDEFVDDEARLMVGGKLRSPGLADTKESSKLPARARSTGDNACRLVVSPTIGKERRGNVTRVWPHSRSEPELLAHPPRAIHAPVLHRDRFREHGLILRGVGMTFGAKHVRTPPVHCIEDPRRRLGPAETFCLVESPQRLLTTPLEKMVVPLDGERVSPEGGNLGSSLEVVHRNDVDRRRPACKRDLVGHG